MRKAVYAGTFDPITAGHTSVIKKATMIFDELVVLVAENPKKVPLFCVADRLEMITNSTSELSNIFCDGTQDIVVNYARKCGAKFLVRGIRGVSDAEYETNLANINKALNPEMTTIFIPADAGLSYLSSSRLKQLVSEGKSISSYCSLFVAKQLIKKMGIQLNQVKRSNVNSL